MPNERWQADITHRALAHGAHVEIRVITEDGELLRELTLDPSRDHQPR